MIEKIADIKGYFKTQYTIQYGSEPLIKNEWKRILQIEDRDERNAEIDKLVDKMEANSENNGFISSTQSVEINPMGNAIYLDDREIYYMFFDNLKMVKEQYPDQPSGFIYAQAIEITLYDYFGTTNGSNEPRDSLTLLKEDENGKMVPPSIKNEKGMNCAACVERASVSHNLWLLSGSESFYVYNPFIHHAYNTVNLGRKHTLFDCARHTIRHLDFDPIEKIRNNEDFVIDDFTYHDPHHISKNIDTNTNTHDEENIK